MSVQDDMMNEIARLGNASHMCDLEWRFWVERFATWYIPTNLTEEEEKKMTTKEAWRRLTTEHGIHQEHMLAEVLKLRRKRA